MRPFSFLVFFILLIFFSCSNSSEVLLKQSKNTLTNSKTISYKTLALYPNPVGQIDTLSSSTVFTKNDRSLAGYDFIFKNYLFDVVQINGKLKSVDHESKIVERFPESEPEQAKNYINNFRDFKLSPLILIKQNEWKHVNDSIINGIKHRGYFKVENDTIIKGNKVYTEQHIFINLKTKLIESWERRNYYKGKLSQTIIHRYSDYKLTSGLKTLAYKNPSSFVSTIYGTKKDIKPLTVGEKAPFFKIKNLQGELINLENYKEKKILLNFSSIGCGYCHEALQFMNQDNYKLPDNIQALYLSTSDQEDKIKRYFTKMEISYPVIPNADKIGKMYGAISTPNFFLINEEGIIEKVVIGYDKKFLESLKNN